MKKNLFFAFFAFIALALVSCEQPTPEPEVPENPTPGDSVVVPGDTTAVKYVLSISQETLTMGLMEDTKLTATVTPSVKADFVWTSSQPEIVSVTSKGIVQAVGLGTATITVTLKDIPAEQVAPATCVITVTNDAIFDNFALGGYGLWELGEPIEGTDTILTISVGDVKCQLCPSLYIVWDNELIYSDQSGFSGAGFLIEVEALTYVIVEGDYAGYYIGNGALYVDSVVYEEPYASYVGEPGKLVDLNAYGDAWNKFLTLTNSSPEDEINAALDLYDNSQVGTQLFRVDFSTEEQSYNYGNVTSATIIEGEGELYYDMNIEWYDAVNVDRLYGLLLDIQVDEEGNELLSIVEPYDMRYIYKQYTYLPMEEPEEDQPAEVSALIKKPIYLSDKQAAQIKSVRKMYKK